RTFEALEKLTVYDNTSGQLIPFGYINEGQRYPIVSDYGDWWQVILGNRIGYVYKNSTERQFSKEDKYFTANTNAEIYDNRTGSLVKIGELKKGQSYQRIGDYGSDWHKIQFGNIYGYVYKPGTSVSTGKDTHNWNTHYSPQGRTFEALEKLTVYDNTSGQLIPFGYINEGQRYPIVSDYGDWWQVILGNRIGYVYKNSTERQFSKEDKYFTANTNAEIYDNRTGSLVKVGELKK